MKKLLAPLLALWVGLFPALAPASTLTPPNLVSTSSVVNADLLLVWTTASAGPLKQIQWSAFKTQLTTDLTGTFLVASNNLSDVSSPATSRSNLGLGTAAVANTGTAGATLGFLNGTNTWSGVQTHSSEIFTAASTTGGPGLNIAQGVAPTSPSNGDFWLTSAAPFMRINGATQQLMLGANNLSEVTTPATARTNIGVAYGTTAGTVAQGNDSRFGGPTQNSQSAAYGLVLGDAGGQIYHPSADTTARIWTIPANGSVAFAIGTKIELVNDCSAGIVTVAITTDTLVWFTSGSTGSRALAACGMATLTKVTSTRWIITGVGLS